MHSQRSSSANAPNVAEEKKDLKEADGGEEKLKESSSNRVGGRELLRTRADIFINMIVQRLTGKDTLFR